MKSLLLLLLTSAAFAQGTRVDIRVTTSQTNLPFGAQAPLLAVPNGLVSICAYPGIASPCINTVSLFSDVALTQPITNPITADGQGNAGFWIAPGTYTYSAQTATGTLIATRAFTAGGTGTGSIVSVNGQVGVVALNAASVGADPAGAASTAQSAAVSSAASTGVQKSANLSDVASPNTARGNLGAAGTGTCTGTQAVQGTTASGVTCYTPPSGATPAGSTGQVQTNAGGGVLGAVTATSTNAPNTIVSRDPTGSTSVAGLTSTQENGTGIVSAANTLATYAAGTCVAGCTLNVPYDYNSTEFSRYFNAQIGPADQYAQMLIGSSGGVSPSLTIDNRTANLQGVSSNEVPLGGLVSLYNARAPYVFEQRVSNRLAPSDDYTNLLLRQRISGQGAANSLVGSQKGNFAALGVDSIIRSPLQGGGTVDLLMRHTAPGDWMGITMQADTFGASETEDEHDKFCRCFGETTTARFGMTLSAAPTVDTAGFGNYAMTGTIASGYDVLQGGENVPLVNLSRLYTTGNYTSITTSPYTGFATVTGDSTANWSSKYGSSAITTITSSIAVTTPDATILNEAGVGGLANQTVAVASTAGFSSYVNSTCFVGGPSSNFEYAKLVSVTDSTHLVLNLGDYHNNSGEVVSCGGAVGYAWSPTADDITAGNFFNYHTQPNTTLHKFWPIMGSNAGALYIYANTNGANTVSTVGYLSTTPNRAAVVSSVSSTGAITLSDHGDYGVAATTGLFGDGQRVLAAPTVTYSGGACTTTPTYTTTLSFGLYAAYQYGLTVTPVTAGVACTSPAATIQSTWAAPYRIAPATATKKVINPSTGNFAGGYLLTGMITPANWQVGDLAEIPNWLHDGTYSLQVFGKYWSGGEDPIKGGIDQRFFFGNYGSSSILSLWSNGTTGYNYFTDATHLQGPGIAFEQPPTGLGLDGDLGTYLQTSYPPAQTAFDFGCGAIQPLNAAPFNPCSNGTANSFNLFRLHTVSGGTEYDLNYNPTGGILAWSGVHKAGSFIGTSTADGTNVFTVDQNVFDGGSFTKGSRISFTNSNIGEEAGKLEALYGFSGYRTLTLAVQNTSGAYASQPELQLLPGSVTVPLSIATAYQETLTTPASSSATCTAGQFADDANYHYVCVSTNTWKRVALSAF